MDNKDFEWKKYLEECLSTTDYCALATVDTKNGSWCNPVYFAWDEKFNFYFISLVNSRHMQNISKDPHVSVAIFSTAQKGEVIGVQLEGDAVILEDEAEKNEAGKSYYGRQGSLEQNGIFQHNPEWLFVKISPKNIYYFNSEVFGEKRQTIPEKVWKNG